MKPGATMTRPANLSDGDFAELLRSGLTVDTMLAAGIYSAAGAEVSAILGYGTGSGLVFPYGTGKAPRVKLHHAGKDGKRYRTQLNGTNRLYIPPPSLLPLERLADPSASLLITEGEKKTLKAVQEGLCCIGLAGVWSWKSQGAPIADLDLIPWQGRSVHIVFDSDVATNAKVQQARTALAEDLARRGAIVSAITLPPGPDGEKVGLDDYLVAHTAERFCELEPEPLATSPPPIDEPVGWPLYDAADAWTFAPPAFTVDDLLPESGVVWLGGAPKRFKSLFCQYTCLAIASDRTHVADHFTIRKRPSILYVAREDGGARLQSRRDDIVSTWDRLGCRGTRSHP